VVCLHPNIYSKTLVCEIAVTADVREYDSYTTMGIDRLAIR
jgi:hypothetical protein